MRLRTHELSNPASPHTTLADDASPNLLGTPMANRNWLAAAPKNRLKPTGGYRCRESGVLRSAGRGLSRPAGESPAA